MAAVHDGYVLQKSVARAPLGGALLTQCMLKSMESKGLTVPPPFSFRRKEKAPGQFEVGPACLGLALLFFWLVQSGEASWGQWLHLV